MEKTTSPAIKKLSLDVQALLRSGNIITNTSQCVTELVLNAIDAKATKIAVRINFNFHKIQVADNGCGVNGEELNLVGERFMTSKCHSMKDFEGNLSYYGFRGEALASLKECSGLLTLESRPKGSDITYAKVYTHGKTHASGISRNLRPAQGTTVTVHDFMYNMPVRRERVQPDFEIAEIKSNLESIALMHPEVSFSFHNEVNHQLVMQTHKSSDTIGVFFQLFDKTIAQSLVSVNYTVGKYSVNGYIGKETHSRKNLRFIYVNKRLVLKTKLHKIANIILGKSFLLRHNAPSHEVPACKGYTTEQWLFFSLPKRDQYAVYIFNIICPHKEYDICLDPKKTLIEFKDWDSVLQCLENAINTFLQKDCNTFTSQETNNSQSKMQDKSLLAEVFQLDRTHDLGEDDKISQELNKSEHAQPIQNKKDSLCPKKQSEKCLPGIHNIFGAVCGAQAKRTTVNNDETDSGTNINKHQVEQKDQHILSQSATVLNQKSGIINEELESCKERQWKNSVITSISHKALVLDHVKGIAADDGPLKIKSTAVNRVKISNPADTSLDILTGSISDNINYVCPIVKFRRMYGITKNTFRANETISGTICNRKISSLQMSVQEKTNTDSCSISYIKQNSNKDHIKDGNETRCNTKHKRISLKHFDSSLSGISEVPVVKYSSKCKTTMHPIDRFRLSMAKKLTHKIQNTNNLGVVVDAQPVTTNVTGQKMHKQELKQSACKNKSATKNNISMHSINNTKTSTKRGLANKKDYVSLIGESTGRNGPSAVTLENSMMERLYLPESSRKQMKHCHQVSKDHIPRTSVQLNEANDCRDNKLKICSPLNEAHFHRLCNKNHKGWQGTNQRINFNSRYAYQNSKLVPLWSLSYMNKRKSDLQTSFDKKKVHFHALDTSEGGVHKYENALFKDHSSSTAFKEINRKYITSADFVQNIDIKNAQRDVILNTRNTKRTEKSFKSAPYLLSNSLGYNFTKHFPENWYLEMVKRNTDFANNKHSIIQNCSFIFSPKQGAYTGDQLTLKEMLSILENPLKSNHSTYSDENIDQAFSTDIMKRYKSIITQSSGSEADVESTFSLKTSGATFFRHMPHPSFERVENIASKIMKQTSNKLNENVHNREKDINSCNTEINETAITDEIRRESQPHASDISPLSGLDKNETKRSPTVAQNTEVKSMSALLLDKDGVSPESKDRLGDTCVEKNVFVKSADNTPPLSPDISLLSQRILENFSEDKHRSSAITEISSHCISSAIANSSMSSFVGAKHMINKAHPENLTIGETSSSEIIDITPEAKRLSERFLLSYEKIHVENTENNEVERESIINSNKEKNTRNNPIEDDKNASCIKPMLHISDSTETTQSDANNYNEQERKRSNNHDLTEVYGKKPCLERTLSHHTQESKCYADILNDSFDKLMNKMQLSDKMQPDVMEVTNATDDRQKNEDDPQKRIGSCKQIVNLTKKYELHKIDTKLQNETAGTSNSTSCNNIQHIYNCSTEAKGAEKELIFHSEQEICCEKPARIVSADSNEREMKDNLNLCNKTKNESSCSEEWEKRTDSNGRQFYIHRESGMPSFLIPDYKSAGISYCMTERYEFLPKGLSPILKGNCNSSSKDQDILTPGTRHAFHDALIQENNDALEELKQVKWRKVQDFKNSGCKDILKMFVEDSEYSMQFCEKAVLKADAKELPKCYNSLFSHTITKDAFSTLKVLGQLDKKFIVVVTMCEEKNFPRYVVLFDQHAIHERIRVEQLMQEYQEDEDNTKFRMSSIDPAISLSLSIDDIQMLQSFRDDFENLGICFEILDDNKVQISGVPTCLLMREIRECKNQGTSILKTQLENLMREQIDCLMATRGSAARVPKTLQAVINSEACRGAIKFGDELSIEECRILLTRLSSCKLPYHCAHGRPSLIPILDLQHLNFHQKPVYDAPDLQKIKKLSAV